jgi:phage/plasmid-like protein (TIGR03299 family)
MSAAVLERPVASKRAAPPWAQIDGVTRITEKTSTAKMLREAGLNGWNIHLVSLSQLVTGYKFIDDSQVVVRKGRGRAADIIMGVVGSRYQPVQNEEIFSFGDALLKIGSGTWDSAGAIKDGRVVFGTVELGREILIGDAKDRVKFYLMVNSSHDGSLSLNVATMPVRDASQSVLAVNLSGAEQAFKMRHTPSVSEANMTAKEAIDSANHYIMRFGVVANSLAARKMTDRQFDNLVQLVYPKPRADVRGAMSRWATKRKQIQEIWEGPSMAKVHGTAWGALCTLIERVDYYRAPRLDNVDNLMVSSSGFDAMTTQEKNRITSAVVKYAKV